MLVSLRSTSSQHTLTLTSDETVSDLRHKIADSTSIAASEQRLVLNGSVVLDAKHNTRVLADIAAELLNTAPHTLDCSMARQPNTQLAIWHALH
jgi:hypothetical protein